MLHLTRADMMYGLISADIQRENLLFVYVNFHCLLHVGCCPPSSRIQNSSPPRSKYLLQKMSQLFRKVKTLFLAPTRAQETLMFVCPSISNLSRAVNLHLFRSEITQKAIRALRKRSENTQKAIRVQWESTQSIKIRVIQSEPKILRLVARAGKLSQFECSRKTTPKVRAAEMHGSSDLIIDWMH